MFVGERQGLQVLETIDEVAIVAAPGYTDAASYEAVLSHCETMKDRFAILDAPKTVDSLDSMTQVATASVKPAAEPVEGEEPAPEPKPRSRDKGGCRARKSDAGFGAYYFPWITIQDPLNPKTLVSAPPSGHIAGVYARVDAARGVHKAPANETLKGALDLEYRVTKEEQGNLNQNGVNCIRFFPAQGIRIWGARTLADSGSEWRYINVRRLFNMIEESIARSTMWVVFEPNDEPLWAQIRLAAGAFIEEAIAADDLQRCFHRLPEAALSGISGRQFQASGVIGGVGRGARPQARAARLSSAALAWATISSTIRGHSGSGRSCPMSATNSDSTCSFRKNPTIATGIIDTISFRT